MCFMSAPSVQQPTLPPPPPPPPVAPTIASTATASNLDAERRRELARQKGRSGTVLTNPLGLDGDGESDNTLLTA
jgi:hypothetical protein